MTAFVDIPLDGSGAAERVIGLVEELGGIGTTDSSNQGVTHLVTIYNSQSQVLKFAREHCKNTVFIVSLDWVIQSHRRFERLDEALYYMPATPKEAGDLLNHLIEVRSKCTHPLLQPMKVPVSEMNLNGLSSFERQRVNLALGKDFLEILEGRVSNMVA